MQSFLLSNSGYVVPGELFRLSVQGQKQPLSRKTGGFPSGIEQELWDRVAAAEQAASKHNKVAAYPCSVTDIPRCFEKVGFENVSVDFIAVTSAADSAHYDMTLREEFIKSNRQVALDAIVLAENYAPGVWSDAEVQQLRSLVEQRFADRLNDLRTGRKVWDIAVSIMIIARGYKPLFSDNMG